MSAAAPVIIDPYATFGDEIAGETPDEVALNLEAATKLAQRFRCKLKRTPPDLKAAFKGCKLSEDARRAARWVHMEYEHAARRRRPYTGQEGA